jgi:hypothetical protein
MLILPRGDSFSRRVMGKYWIHNIPEHWIHYSQKGLIKLWGEYGWKPIQTFYPLKTINLSTVSNHLKIMKLPHLKISNSFSFPFNFGEMGLVFKKVTSN